MLKTIWENLKTSVMGGIAGGSLIQEGINTRNYSLIVTGVATLLLGLLSKDVNK